LKGGVCKLCGYREYQKEAIQTTLRFLLGGKYANLRALAKENFEENTELFIIAPALVFDFQQDYLNRERRLRSVSLSLL
jgi:hypothetical protein